MTYRVWTNSIAAASGALHRDNAALQEVTTCTVSRTGRKRSDGDGVVRLTLEEKSQTVA